MTTTARATDRSGYPSRRRRMWSPLLVDDGSAERLAAVAVQEAVARRAPVHFLQVLSVHLHEEGCSLVEEEMFRAGLHALRGHPCTHSVFEVVRSRPSVVIRIRSRDDALVGCPVRKVPVLGWLGRRALPFGSGTFGPCVPSRRRAKWRSWPWSRL